MAVISRFFYILYYVTMSILAAFVNVLLMVQYKHSNQWILFFRVDVDELYHQKMDEHPVVSGTHSGCDSGCQGQRCSGSCVVSSSRFTGLGTTGTKLPSRCLWSRWRFFEGKSLFQYDGLWHEFRQFRSTKMPFRCIFSSPEKHGSNITPTSKLAWGGLKAGIIGLFDRSL